MRFTAHSILGIWLLGATALFAAESAPDASSDALSFDYFRNNWNVIGLKDYVHGSRITPNNEMLLSGAMPVQIRLGPDRVALSREQGKRAMEGWMPIMLVEAVHGPIRYNVTYWATPLPDVKDWRKAFDWPTEGENFLCWIRIEATNTSDAPAEAFAELNPARVPAKTRAFKWSWRLEPGATAHDVARYTFFPSDNPKAYDKEDADVWLDRTREFWKDLLTKKTAHIEVPCRKASESLLAAHVCQAIANDHGDLRGGEGFYDEFYIRDGAYQVMELEEAGLHDTARKAVKLYLDRQRPDGRFESQPGQFDANGQAVWVLWQYYKMSADRAWLQSVYPNMRRAADWTMQARRLAPADSPYVGVLPNALADGEYLWQGAHHILGYDFWNLRGLLCTADAARILGKTGEAAELLKEAALYREAIDAAWKKTGLAHFPPSWEKAGTHWGNTETLWPTEIFKRDDARVGALIDHVREDFGGGFIEGTIRWLGHAVAIHPYMGAYTTMADLVRGNDEKVVEDFYWYLLHSTAAHAFPEGIYYERRYAWGETIPHVTGACNYAIMLRHMLVHEEGDELHLLKAVPDWWLADGEEIRVERLPTHFGPMNLVVRGTARGVRVDFDPPKRNPPKRIVLHLPKSRPLVGKLDGVDVVARADQKKRWDFPTVVSLYKQSDPPPVWIAPDVPSLTTGRPATCSTSLSGYPAQLANDGRRGNPNAFWATDIASQNDPAPWWRVDLEEPKTVGRVVVVGYYADSRYYGFTVETSLGGTTWEMAADRRDNKELATAEGYPCVFEPRKVRYIRVTQTQCSANTGRHLVEVMAYGP